MPDRAARHLTGRYGPAAAEVMALAAAHPQSGEPVVADHADLLAEATYAARDEQACSVGDFLLRRTRLALVAPRDVTGPAVARRVADAMAAELDWTVRRTADETSAWLREARGEGLAPFSVDRAPLPA